MQPDQTLLFGFKLRSRLDTGVLSFREFVDHLGLTSAAAPKIKLTLCRKLLIRVIETQAVTQLLIK